MNSIEPSGPLVPNHPEKSFQHPVEATKIFLDRALAVIQQNDAIDQNDRDWFVRYCAWLIEQVDPKWLANQI